MGTGDERQRLGLNGMGVSSETPGKSTPSQGSNLSG